jgi:hypothetical protein
MKTFIEIVLALIALYSGFAWASWAITYYRGRPVAYSFMDIQMSMIGCGVSGILALGFLGLML